MYQGSGTTNGSYGSASASSWPTRKRKSSYGEITNEPPSKQPRVNGQLFIDDVCIQGLSLTARTTPAGFMDMPPEILLDIFHETASSGCPQDVIDLALSSRKAYQVYSSNKVAILRRQVSELINVSSRTDGLLVDYIIKVALLTLATKGASDNPGHMKRALATATDTTIPVSAPPLEAYTWLIYWVKELSESPAFMAAALGTMNGLYLL